MQDAFTFIEHAFDSNSLNESMVVEFKAKRNGSNIAEAVGAFANTDVGLLLVGVDAELPLEECMVGLTQSSVDSPIDHLQQLMRDAMPEVIPLRLPASDRLLVILRVRADESRQPVVVEGRVMLRFPGRSVGARREDIRALVLRDVQDRSGAPIPGSAIADPARLPLWPEDDLPEFVVRVFLSARLSSSVLDHLWLGSSSKDACISALNDGPIPDQILRGFPRRVNDRAFWEIDVARSTFFGVATPWTSPSAGLGDVTKSGRAKVNLHGTTLSVCTALGLRGAARFPVSHLNLDDLYAALSGTAVSCLHALTSVTSSLTSVPAADRNVSAWLQPAEASPWAVDCGLMGGGAVTVTPHDTWLRPHPLKTGSLDELDSVVRTWLDLMLLDSGASGFEDTIDRLRPSSWAQGE